MFLIKKKIVARFDKKIATWRKKSTDDPREESITANYAEDPINEDPKENSIDEKPKEDPITVKPKDNSINEDLQEPQDPQ